MKTRLARQDDFDGILVLYRVFAQPGDPMDNEAEMLIRWNTMLEHQGLFVCVAEQDGVLTSTCTLTVAPQLAWSGWYGLIENVVTHPAHRRAGHGRATIRFALQTAWSRGCYKVMLLARADNAIGRAFYRSVGLSDRNRVGYVVYRRDCPDPNNTH